jgi:hypothetical protein
MSRHVALARLKVLAAGIKKLERKPRQYQSKVSTGRKMVTALDGRRTQARRFRDLCADMIGELGHEPSCTELALVREAATAIAASEQLQAKAIMGEANGIELEMLGKLSHVITRTIGMLGLKHGVGTSGLNLESYLKGKAKGDADA